MRTGWDSNETTLTPENVPGLQLLTSASLDEQVDAQPLLVNGLTISGQGTHDVLYVATENDTVYALDAATGATLATRNFGTPVAQSALPGQCFNNSGVVGINSTPVINPASSTIYVMVYTFENNVPIYRLHALDLSTLNDKVAPAVVNASAKMSNGNQYQFNSTVNRQRSGLLLAANGNIYAGFASFCDFGAGLSRGWLLGWNSGTLTPLAANHLDNQLAQSTNDFFLSSIWMSGYGVAADPSSNLYFTTGNSDYSGTSYSSTYNLSESVVKLSPNLKTVESFFTPSGNLGVTYLDQNDYDTGSGGVLLLPNQSGTKTPLAVAAGKVGNMYLLNRNNLGGYNTAQNNVLGTFPIGFCWCGQSYFQGWDSIGRVVSSGGNNIIVWRVSTSSTPPTLVQESMSPQLSSGGQDPGFFTTVSSNGEHNAVVWAVGRPAANSTAVTLYAFDPSAAAQGSTSWLFSAVAGTWPNTQGNANILPVVANGRVYVASYQQLAIFGLGSTTAALQAAQTTQQTAAQPVQTAVQDPTKLPANGHEVFGTINTVNGDMITITTRNGKSVDVDATEAVQAYLSVVLLVDEHVRILGTYDASNILHATSIARAKPSPQLWPPDR